MADIVSLSIGFDEGTLGAAEVMEFGAALIETGLVKSTGTYQRFVSGLLGAGFIEPSGKITEAGQEYVEMWEG